jgi:hypothetical protein
MVAYVVYAERFGWTPEQVDRLTVEQDDWLIPIAQAFDAEREYREKKAQEAAERKARAKQNVTGS